MHRTNFVPRSLICFLAGLVWLGLGGALRAQEATVLVVPINTTKQVEMSKKQLIETVRVENPKVAKVTVMMENPRAVLVTGVAEGTTRVFLTATDKSTEHFDVMVPSDAAKLLEQARQQALILIRRTVPTASVDLIALANNTVILTGTVMQAEDVPLLTELARSVMPQATVVNNTKLGGVQQVGLEVTVARVSRSELRNMSFNFLESRGSYFIGSILKGPLTLAGTISPAISGAAQALSVTGPGNLPFGVVQDKHSFSAFLEALRTEGLAKLHSEPFVVTMSGRPAYVLAGGQVPVLTSTGQGSPTVSYKDFGTVVNFVPLVLGNGKIYLDVRPEVSSRNAANDLFIPGLTPTAVPGFDNRSAQVAVVLEDGQTLAIGGLIQHSVDGTTSKVPILGDLPFLGAAFRSISYKEVEEELIILVTPRLVDPLACTQLPKHVLGDETRSPDDFELFLEGILEAPRGQRQVFPDHSLRSYRASHLGGPTASVYPCGDANGNGHGANGHGANGQGGWNWSWRGRLGQCSPYGNNGAAVGTPRTDMPSQIPAEYGGSPAIPNGDLPPIAPPSTGVPASPTLGPASGDVPR